jgi:hypothetical protein
MPNNKIHCRLGRVCVLAFCVILLVSVLGCATEEITLPGAAQTMQLSSPAFGDGERIPAKYTCDAEDISPPLTWTEPPPHTQAFVLIMDDPDAPGGTFTHWVLFNLPAATRELAEATPDEKAGIRPGSPRNKQLRQNWLRWSLSPTWSPSSLSLHTLCPGSTPESRSRG